MYLYLCSVQTNKKDIQCPITIYSCVMLLFAFALFGFLSICMSIGYSVPPPMGLSTAPHELCTKPPPNHNQPNSATGS